MTGLAISTTGLVHIYRAHGHDVAALSGIGITVRPGELVGLLGPSGAESRRYCSCVAVC